MQCINGILMLEECEKNALEAIIGPITCYEVENIRYKLVCAVEREEAIGFFLWAKIIRSSLANVSAFAGH